MGFKEDLTIRTARKRHRCDAHQVFRICKIQLRCDGMISPGERYYDDRREAWELLKYHIRCGAYGSLPTKEKAK